MSLKRPYFFLRAALILALRRFLRAMRRFFLITLLNCCPIDFGW